MKIVKGLLICASILLLFGLSHVDVEAAEEQDEKKVSYGIDISTDNSEHGVVDVFYYQKTPKKMKVVVQNGKSRYVYNLFSGKEWTSYPLQLGDGTYKISIYENTSGSKYKKIMTEQVNIQLDDPNIVHLQSIQEINWNEDSQAIIFTQEMLAEIVEAMEEDMPDLKDDEGVELTDEEKIEIIYEFILGAIAYDFEKIKGLDYTYLPNIDETLEEGTGICYDYSSLFASMLRSEGIPTRMVKGYANTSEVYHAWNEVYFEEEWLVVDTTYDAYMYQNDRKYSFEKDADKFNKVKFY